MGVVSQGIASVLNLSFPSPSYGWYVGLIDNVPNPVLSISDTLASHSGWSEAAYGVAYSGAGRPQWTNGVVSNNQLVNSVAVSFSIIATTTVYGIFLTDVATGTTGNIFGTVQFVGGPRSVVNSDTIELTLTLTGTSS